MTQWVYPIRQSLRLPPSRCVRTRHVKPTTPTSPSPRPSSTSDAGSGTGDSSNTVPRPVRTWMLTTLREKLIKIGAKVVSHSKAVTFQLAEVAVPCSLFAAILERIDQLRAIPGTG
jgi:Transposase DDE domain group 1